MESPGLVSPDSLGSVATLSTRQCEQPSCGQMYHPKRKAQRFCSQLCRTRWWEERHPRVSVTHTARKAEGSIKVALLALMADGQFRTVDQMAAAVGASPATVSARLRGDVKREAKAQGLTLLRDQLRGNGHTPHRYRLAKEAA